MLEFINEHLGFVITGVGVFGAGGFGIYAAIKKAIKEVKEAVEENIETYEEARILIAKIKQYKKYGFSESEIDDLLNRLEKFYTEAQESIKETKEAIDAIQSLWKMIKKLVTRKKK